MRKLFVALALASTVVLAACGNDNPTVGGGSTGASTGGSAGTSTSGATGSQTAAACAQANASAFKSSGTLTIGTDNPAFEPWFGGTGTYGPWKANPNGGTGNPARGDGYESATAYAIADQLGFSHDQVTWVPVDFNESYKPGPKDFDFYMAEVSYLPERDQAVDFSESYYDVSQALVAKKGTPIASATTFADLKPYKLGAQVGTTSYNYIVNNIQPDQQPAVFDRSTDVIQAFNNGQIDGYVVDAPTAYVNVLIGQAKDGVVVGQFPAIGDQEYFGLVFETGSPLVSCVNTAIDTLRSDGTLDGLDQKWLKAVTFPEISQ
jgi:polar amino acid transport system substrate-binding protein